MAYRKATMRKLPETSRKLARLINEVHSISRRLDNLVPEIYRLEHDSIALYKATEAMKPEKGTRKPKTKTEQAPLFTEAPVGPQPTISEPSLDLPDQSTGG